jgi:hypothetical protein
VFLFRADKAPDFIALQTANAHVSHVLIVVFGASFAEFD